MFAPLAAEAEAGGDGRPLVATALALSDPRTEALAAAGVEVLSLPDGSGARVDLPALFAALGRLPSGPVTSVLVEGGGELAAQLFAHRLVHQLLVHQASCLYGAGGVPAIGALPQETRLTLDALQPLGDDLELDFSVAR
jgi:diaminohydroxyphosphoribosylaminopyrimidine deaminase/5-amino-6-(5-phosphoribosylamino)uracil reductase